MKDKKINKTESFEKIFEKINQVDKPIARLTKKERQKTQTTKTRDERGDIPNHLTKIKWIIIKGIT